MTPSGPRTPDTTPATGAPPRAEAGGRAVRASAAPAGPAAGWPGTHGGCRASGECPGAVRAALPVAVANGPAARGAAGPTAGRPGAHGRGRSGEPPAGVPVRAERRRPYKTGHARLARLVVPALVLALFTGLPGLTAPAYAADGIRAQEWALEALRTEEAWRTTKGEGVTVAVLDTGVDDEHPDLAGQVLEGKDFIGFGAGRGDRAWARHGTAMAGIIAGHGHGEDRADGVLGIAPEAKILPVRVILEDGDPDRKKARGSKGSALAEGIRWAADQGADVINLSLGDDSESAHPEPGEDAAVQYALRKGAVVVASAGNGGEEGDHVSYPAAYPGVIAVTAVDRYGSRAAFSTRRWYATVCAPGVDVVIADPDRRYYEGWGTSAAAAFVSGSVALVRSAHPELSPAQIKRLLEDTARNAPEGGRDDSRGAGLVDPAAAIRAGAKVEPAAQRPSPVPYEREYFGAGPAEDGGDGGPGFLAPAVGTAGGLLLAAGGVLWYAGRRRPEDENAPLF